MKHILLLSLFVLSACSPDPANDCLHQFGKWESSDLHKFGGSPLQQRCCDKCGMMQLRELRLN